MIVVEFFVLKFIWWVLLSVLISSVAVMEGFDYGVLFLMPLICKTDDEKRLMINSIGPVWEGNQIWLIAFGVMMFGAWPSAYVVTTTVFFIPVFILIFSLAFRPSGFKLRSKIDSKKWRNFWDIALCISGLIPSVIFGVAIGNIVQGVDFEFKENFLPVFTGNLMGFFSPFALLCGVFGLVLSIVQGSIYTCCRATGDVFKRALCVSKVSTLVFVLILIMIGAFLLKMNGYSLVDNIDFNSNTNILSKSVELEEGAWRRNYSEHKLLLILPFLAVGFMILSNILLRISIFFWAFISSSISIILSTFSFSSALFPFIMPSSSKFSHSLTVWDASGGKETLYLMLTYTVLFLPVIVLYSFFTYKVFGYKLRTEDVKNNSDEVY